MCSVGIERQDGTSTVWFFNPNDRSHEELLAEIQKIRAESAIKYKQLQLDYERLAGAYQKETEKKIIRL